MATTRKKHRSFHPTKAQRKARKKVSDAFDFDRLKVMCETHELTLAELFPGMVRVEVNQPAPDNYFYFKDNGSRILAVAHLDTVVDHAQRTTVLAETAGGDVVYSGALDDRLGAYIVADLLPAVGEATGRDLTFDLLFTVGEEMGCSTAAFFDANEFGKEYDWIIQFDRGGTDVVLYQYEDDDLIERVENTGALVESGAFSDISFLEHVGVKAMNWGCGYRDYHGPRGHVWLDDMFEMVGYFISFHDDNRDTTLPHENTGRGLWSGNSWGGGTEYEILDEPGHEGSTECEVAAWGVGDCDGPLVDRAGYDFICAKHAEWSDTA